MPIAITEVLFRSAVILWLILIFSILSTFHTNMKFCFNELFDRPKKVNLTNITLILLAFETRELGGN